MAMSKDQLQDQFQESINDMNIKSNTFAFIKGIYRRDNAHTEEATIVVWIDDQLQTFIVVWMAVFENQL